MFDLKNTEIPMYLPTLAMGATGPLFVVVHSDLPPTDADYQAYLEAVAVNRSKAILVVTPGSGPSPKQREMNRHFVEEHAQMKGIKISVVTPNRAVRAIVTIMSWIIKSIDTFHPSKLDDAVARLGVPQENAVRSLALAQQMQQELLDRGMLRPVSAFLVRQSPSLA